MHRTYNIFGEVNVHNYFLHTSYCASAVKAQHHDKRPIGFLRTINLIFFKILKNDFFPAKILSIFSKTNVP
jgi:hypothetical protein